jgi:hypothetical protein
MGSTESLAEAAARANADGAGARSLGALRALRRLIAGERVRVLRELDDFLLRDIGASGDDIWRVHQLRNGERPTLLVG